MTKKFMRNKRRLVLPAKKSTMADIIKKMNANLQSPVDQFACTD